MELYLLKLKQQEFLILTKKEERQKIVNDFKKFNGLNPNIDPEYWF